MPNIRGTRDRGKWPTAREVATMLGATPTTHGWTARCPAHDDTNPSLSIAEGAGGKALICCHRGCTFLEVMAALGVRPRERSWHDRQRSAARANNAVGRALQRRNRP
jgi:hypothetical protein